jgi:hypothetical protein
MFSLLSGEELRESSFVRHPAIIGLSTEVRERQIWRYLARPADGATGSGFAPFETALSALISMRLRDSSFVRQGELFAAAAAWSPSR